mmetsp:Transcript_24346/g.56391  ORF Transcript_24346/g.56391 Transcript_24346/m.56391 type:complete len:240 (+) Transcript_24346:33-752(+)
MAGFSADILDLEQAKEMTGGDEDFLKEVLQDYVTQAAKQIDTLMQAQLAGNAEQLRFEAHAVKGSSATVGAKRVSEAAKNLEQLAATCVQSGQTDLSYLKSLVEHVKAEFELLLKCVPGESGGGGFEEKPIDEEKAIEMTGGDRRFLKEILDEFIQHSHQQRNTLQDSVASENREKLRFEAHAIKGSAATIGANHLSQIALELEKVASDSSRTAPVGPLVSNLLQEFERVEEWVKKFQV